jgi:predicted nicotinamide N-methyase
MKINRRQILQLGAGSLLAALASPFIGSSVYAQGNKSPAAVAADVSAAKLDGNITYNAGWVVPMEDKAALLEVEAKKTKEREALAKQKAGNSPEGSTLPKEKSKSVADRFQEVLGKIKNFF